MDSGPESLRPHTELLTYNCFSFFSYFQASLVEKQKQFLLKMSKVA